MGLLGTLLGGSVLVIAGACISFVFDELSEEERRRQEEMRREYKDYEQRRQRDAENTYNYYAQKQKEEKQRYQEQLRRHQAEMLQRKKDENSGAFHRIQGLWQCQYDDKKKLHKECSDIIKACKKSIKDQQHTYARFNAMKTTLLSLQEAAYKLEAYLRYMDDYWKKMDGRFEESGELLEPFSMTLPKEYPYEGKLFFLDKEDFSGYSYHFAPIGWTTLDADNQTLFERSSGRLPFMYHTANNGRSYLSLTKGLLKNSAGGMIGLEMKVIKVSPRSQWITLRFLGDPYIHISISKNDLNSPYRKTPIGSSLHVYVKDYDFALRDQVNVSQRAEDGMSIAQFGSVAMLLTPVEYHKLYEYIKKHGLMDETAEWRIGPYKGKQQDMTGLILQHGEQYALQAVFETVGKKGLALRYQGMLDAKDFLTFDDPFVTTNVTVTCYSQDTVLSMPDKYEEYFEECLKLQLYLTQEFARQRKMLARSPMNLYLGQWQEVTRRLIDYRIHGGHLQLQVDEWKSFKRCTLLHIEEPNLLQKFIDRESEKNRPRPAKFFMEFPDDDGRRYNYNIISNKKDNIWLRVERELSAQTISEYGFTLDLYSLGDTYTEKQQLNAFCMFKEDRVTSQEIKTAIIDIGSYRYTDTGQRITDLFDQNIGTNPAQRGAVSRAFSEKNFFLIQGPPGTGKTTVIKELILQQLKADPAARIIVVSQANVAVDNVLRGIVKINGQNGKIIRCGNEDKITDSDVKEYSFDHRFAEYKKALQSSIPQDSKVQILRDKWLKILDDKENADLIGECFLGCFQIVGATCLGLENSHYGLKNIEFDLAVIDEAGKALAGELLIPINRAKKVIIIGDHLQLPPVVDPLLYQGGDLQYDDVVEQKQQEDFTKRSFFQRLYDDCPDDSKCMLDIQFRMPPDIADMISTLFYDGTLKTGENCYRKKPMFLGHHLIFLDMKDEPDYQERQYKYQNGTKSGPYNIKEQEAASAVIRRVRTCYDGRIVVITPYKKQKGMLERYFKQEDLIDQVSVNTIDAFQGDEADIVIYCTTRAKQPTEYFSDKARLNVAFSRTKNTLIFLGSSGYLRKYPKDHVLQGIRNYLRKHAAIVPYAQWQNIDLQYNANFKGY